MAKVFPEEQVVSASNNRLEARGYIRKEQSLEVVTEDAGPRTSYYRFRIELDAGSYTLHNAGEDNSGIGAVGEKGYPVYFAHKASAIAAIKELMGVLGLRILSH